MLFLLCLLYVRKKSQMQSLLRFMWHYFLFMFVRGFYLSLNLCIFLLWLSYVWKREPGAEYFTIYVTVHAMTFHWWCFFSRFKLKLLKWFNKETRADRELTIRWTEDRGQRKTQRALILPAEPEMTLSSSQVSAGSVEKGAQEEKQPVEKTLTADFPMGKCLVETEGNLEGPEMNLSRGHVCFHWIFWESFHWTFWDGAMFDNTIFFTRS